MRELPPGWTFAPIDDLGELRLGKMLDKAKNQGLPAKYLRNINVRWFRFDLDDMHTIFVSPAELEQLSVQDGDLFVCEGGEPGRCAVWRGGENDFVYQKALHRFRSQGGMVPTLLMYRLRHDAETGALPDAFTGTTIKHLTRESLGRFKVPVPPLPEQERIADKLDALLARVDACRARLDRVPSILKRLRQSILAAATSGVLTNEWREEYENEPTGTALLDSIRTEHHAFWTKEHPGKVAISKREPELQNEALDEVDLPTLPSTWAWATGADVVEPGAEIVYGIVQPGPKLNIGVPYVRGMDIENGTILVDQLMRTSPSIAARYSRSSLQPDDVLLGIIRATKVAVVPRSLAGGNITQGTARFRPSSVISTQYLSLALQAPNTQDWLHAHYRGIDMPGLNLADVRRVPIALPPAGEQDEIVRRTSRLLEAVDHLEASHGAATSSIKVLTPAALAKAFRGELVAQDPNDEPASALLERIRSAGPNPGRPPISGKQRQSRPRKELDVAMKKLIDVLANAGDWMDAQDAFRACGIADGANTDLIEGIYSELRELERGKRVVVKVVKDAKGRKLHDRLKLAATA